VLLASHSPAPSARAEPVVIERGAQLLTEPRRAGYNPHALIDVLHKLQARSE
jgi:hypothetical protein